MFESKGGGDDLAPFARMVMELAGVYRCLEELWLSKVCSLWLVPWLVMQDSGAVMKELPQEGLYSPCLFFKSGNYQAPQMLREASLSSVHSFLFFCLNNAIQ